MKLVFSQKSDEKCLLVCKKLGLTEREKSKALTNRPLLLKFYDEIYKPRLVEQKEEFIKPKKANRPSGIDDKIKIYDKITTGTGLQMSFIQIDLKTNSVVGIYESLSGLSRALNLYKSTLLYRLNKRPIQCGYLIKQIERVKFCKSCERWLVGKEMYKYTLDSGAIKLSSECKRCTCENKKKKRRERV